MKEHLARFTFKNGDVIGIHKEDLDLSVVTNEHSLVIPHATGQQMLDWCALFEGLSEKAEYPEGKND